MKLEKAKKSPSIHPSNHPHNSRLRRSFVGISLDSESTKIVLVKQVCRHSVIQRSNIPLPFFFHSYLGPLIQIQIKINMRIAFALGLLLDNFWNYNWIFTFFHVSVLLIIYFLLSKYIDYSCGWVTFFTNVQFFLIPFGYGS